MATVRIAFGNIDLFVGATWDPGTPSTMYSANGDPGEEGDPEELELREVRIYGHDKDLLPLLEALGATEEIYKKTLAECRRLWPRRVR